jgi:hypothetical protein
LGYALVIFQLMVCCARAIIGNPRVAVAAPAAPAVRNERRFLDMVASR